MKTNLFIHLLLLIASQGSLADFTYSCTAANGASMEFITTSIFGDYDEPLLSYTDENKRYFDSDELVVRKNFDNYYVRGFVSLPDEEDTRFFATFKLVDDSTSDVPANLKLKNSSGELILDLQFTCQFSLP